MSQLYSWKENSTRCFHRITNTVFHSCWLVAKQKKKEKTEIMLGLRFGTKAGKFFECHDSGYMSHRTGDRESKSQNQSFCYEHSALTLMVEMKKQLKPEKFSDFLMSHKWLTGELLNMFHWGPERSAFASGMVALKYLMKWSRIRKDWGWKNTIQDIYLGTEQDIMRTWNRIAMKTGD